MATSGLKQVLLRNDFYRDNFRRLVFLLMISLILNVVLVAVYVTKTRQPVQTVYFATTPSGKLIKLQPLSVPILNDAAVQAWVSRAVPQIYALDFLNYRDQLERARSYFTPFGYTNFLKAFNPTIKKIIGEKLVTHAVPSGVPVITSREVINGVYSWNVQIPIVVSFQKSNQEDVKHTIWSVVVQRTTSAKGNNVQLLGISQIVQRQGG